MTNLDYLNSIVPELDTVIKEAVMTSREVTSGDVYSGGEAIELAEADLYMRIALMPEFTEGSLSIKYHISSLKEEANRIYLKWGDARGNSGRPTIKRISL